MNPRKSARPAALLLLALLAALTLAGCLGGLPEGVEQATVETKAKQATDLALAADYQGLLESFRPDIAEALTLDSLAAIQPYLDKAGPFVDYASFTAGTQKTDTGETIVALVTAECENQKLIFTLTLDTDAEITGFWVKDG